LEIGTKGNNQVKVPKNTLTAESTQENGLTISGTAKALSQILLEFHTQENLKKDSSMVKEF